LIYDRERFVSFEQRKEEEIGGRFFTKETFRRAIRFLKNNPRRRRRERLKTRTTTTTTTTYANLVLHFQVDVFAFVFFLFFFGVHFISF